MQTADFSLCSQTGEGAKELCGVSFIEALIPFMRVILLLPKYFPKAPSPNTTTLDIRISTCELCGDANVQAIAQSLPQRVRFSHLLPQSSVGKRLQVSPSCRYLFT